MNLIVVSVSVLSLQEKKRWICFSIYMPPSTENIKTFFEEMNEVISKALFKYENLMVMADFNIDNKVLMLTSINWKLFAIFLT